jgi:hypothetical protein
MGEEEEYYGYEWLWVEEGEDSWEEKCIEMDKILEIRGDEWWALRW